MFIFHFLINFYIVVIFTDVILSYLPQFHHHPFRIQVKKLADYSCAPIRKYMPKDLPLDFSPLIVIFGLKAIQGLLL